MARYSSFKQAYRPLDLFNLLPPELLEYIFTLACFDGGRTGRSLSLVSRSVSAISKPIIYQSLAIFNLKQAEVLATILTATPPDDRRVVHLFVRCNYEEMYRDAIRDNEEKERQLKKTLSPLRRLASTFSHPLSGQKVRETEIVWDHNRRELVNANDPTPPLIENLMNIALMRILSAISTTLQTLTVVFQAPIAGNLVSFSPSLPASISGPRPSGLTLCNLRELSITYGPDRYPVRATRLLDTFSAPLRALKRLDLDGYYSNCPPAELLEQISRLAPGITHVRLPRVQSGWIQWLNPSSSITTPASELQVLPSTVQKIYIRPPPPPPPLTLSLLHEYRTRTLTEHHALAAKDERIVLLRPEAVRDQGWKGWKFDESVDGPGWKVIEKRWIERIQGGDGCWNREF